MPEFPWGAKALGKAFGSMPSEFTLDVEPGYTALVGPNNAGKSTILQALFKAAFEDDKIGAGRVCLLPPERGVVAATSEAGGTTLEQYNHNVWAT